MFDFNLPLKDDFIIVVKNNNINNWQAKDFWSKFDLIENISHFKLCQFTYIGLKILIKKGFLTYTISPINKKIFLYNETEKLNKLRIFFHQEKHTMKLNEYKETLLLKNKENKTKIEFSKQILIKHPELKNKINTYTHNLTKDINHYNILIKTLDELIKII